MKTIGFDSVTLTSGYLFDKQELNRKITIGEVYDRFSETGRIAAFDFDYVEGVSAPEGKPHIYWDSDVAKWIEGASYILAKHPSPDLEAKIDALVQRIKANQGADGYFNIYYTVVDPSGRFTGRSKHELYCAGHLMEAAVAYAKATGKRDFLDCMEKYADCIWRVFVEEKSAAFSTPGHEEIELAFIKMYRYTGEKRYLDLAAHFINTRGTTDDKGVLEGDDYTQSDRPVRARREAVGHAVRAMYLYTGMAMLARETGDGDLAAVCRAIFDDAVYRKMYVTGGIGSTRIGEAFTNAYDLPNDTAYAETCAAIGLVFFSNAMMALENDARYADVIERVLYNGILSGLSLDGKAFFYENPLEITKRDRFENIRGKRKLPITQRPRCFETSCCPPNLNRLLASLGDYVYGVDGDVLYVNQFLSSTLSFEGVSCRQETTYPNGNTVKLSATGASRIAIRIPSWCDRFKINKPYAMVSGYAVVENDGTEVCVCFDMKPKAVFGDCRVKATANRLCVMRGPIVYCAEEVDNGPDLHAYVLPASIAATEELDGALGLYTLKIPCKKREAFCGVLYRSTPPTQTNAVLKMIPYHAFANRGESDMLVWMPGEY